jgi:NAD+ kinase
MAAPAKKVLVLTRITTFEQLTSTGGKGVLDTLARQGKQWFERIEEAHEEHLQTLKVIRDAVRELRLKARFVSSMEGIEPARFDAVITAGGDGTVLHGSHHVDHTPMLGVRSSRHSAGYLTGADRNNVHEKLAMFAQGTLASTTLQRMTVLIGGRVAHDKVLNEALFSHPNPAVTTRYTLVVNGLSEEQMSSGLWVGPAAGSTAAIRAAGGRVLAPSSRNLQWLVREHISRPGTRVALQSGLVRPGREIRIYNKWQPSRLYLDGPHLTVGVRPAQDISMRLSDRPLTLLGWSKRQSARRR